MAVCYFLRHGDVENPHSVWYGNLPGFPLSDKGRKQIVNSVHALAKTKPEIFAIIRSPNQRAKDSARIAGNILGLDKFYEDVRLRDWQTDEWEGQNYDHLIHDSGYYAKPMRIPWKEKLDDLADRVKATILETQRKFPEKNLLFVGHREPFVAYIMREIGQPFTDIHAFDMPKSAIWRLEIENGKVYDAKRVA